MSAWQFDLHCLSESAVLRALGHVPARMSREVFEEGRWWPSDEDAEAVRAAISRLLPRGQSWTPSIEVWGEQEGDRIDLSIDEHGMRGLFVRIDVRKNSFAFLSQLVQLGRKNKWVFLASDGAVLRPSLRMVLSAIRRSSSYRWVDDPRAFLDALSLAHDDPAKGS
jgi:hypothetical protein